MFSVDSELDAEESPTKDATNTIEPTFTSNSRTETCLNHHLADGVTDSGVDSESTTTPSSPEDGVIKDASSDTAIKPDEHKVDSDVMETAEMLLSLSGSNNVTNNATSMNGSNNYYKTRCRGLKDEFIKSLRLQKKEKLKSAPSRKKVTGEENAGRNLFSIYIYIYIYIYIFY